MSKDDLNAQIVEPWLMDKPFIVGGLYVSHPERIQQIRITHTVKNSHYYYKEACAKLAQIFSIYQPPDRELLPFDPSVNFSDFTHELLLKNKQSPSRSVTAQYPKLLRSHLRKILLSILKTDSQLDAFCLDYFDPVAQQFTNGMDKTAKLNLLLKENLEHIYSILQAEYPNEVTLYEEAMIRLTP